MWILVQDIQERVLDEIKSVVTPGMLPVGLGRYNLVEAADGQRASGFWHFQSRMPCNRAAPV